MRHSIAITAILLLGLAACQRSTVAPSDDSDTSTGSDTGGGACPFDCIYPSACMAVNGEAHSEYSCAELGTICCDLSDADTATESETASDADTDTDVDTDTYLGTCPYICENQLLCDQADGWVHEGYEPCPNPSHVCCEEGADTDVDTDTGTGLPDCPYECMTFVLCELLSGTVHEEYGCPGDSICCEDLTDTDKGAP